jgi:hypothetical protein
MQWNVYFVEHYVREKGRELRAEAAIGRRPGAGRIERVPDAADVLLVRSVTRAPEPVLDCCAA